MTQVVRIATRGSALARWQADHVADLLRAAAAAAPVVGAGVDADREPGPDGSAATAGIEIEIVVVQTDGDRRQDVPIWEIGGKGVFVKEVQAAVLDGRADLAVHSAKDLPSETHDDLVIAAVPERADPRDVLVGSTLADLTPGALIATGSVRRRAQLAWIRPDLTFSGLRGNIDTRLGRIPPGGAIVMAAAPLHRMSLMASVQETHGAEVLSPAVMLPQVGQGALAIEARRADERMLRLLRHLDHGPSRRTFDAERGFLAELGGDCDLPAGAHATIGADGTLTVEGVLASLDGHTVIRHSCSGAEDGGTGLGRAVARFLLDDAGGAALLDR